MSGYVRLLPGVRGADIESYSGSTTALISYSNHYKATDSLPNLIRTSRLGALWHLFRQQPSVIEVPEPLWIKEWPYVFIVVCFIRLRAAVSRSFTPIVITYAIENLPANEGLRLRRVLPLPIPIPSVFDRFLLWGWSVSFRVLDGIIFGTKAAQDNYLSVFRLRRKSQLNVALVWDELPSCDCISASEVWDIAWRVRAEERVVLFASEMSERKGFTTLITAWRCITNNP